VTEPVGTPGDDAGILEPEEQEPEELHIRSAEDLFKAIRGAEHFTRLQLLEALVADPGVGLGYGSHDGQDVVDVLRLELEGAGDQTVRALLMAALANLPDEPRAVAALFREWCVSPSADEQLLALERLAFEPDAEVQKHLTVMLRQDDDPDRARMIANVWAWREGLSDEDRLRVAIACEFESAPPPALTAQNATAWRQALNGAFRNRAREWLEPQGKLAFDQLLSWPVRSVETDAWLLEWGSSAGFAGVQGLVQHALESDDTAQNAAGLQALARPGVDSAETHVLLERFADAAPELRLAAVRAGLRFDAREAAINERDLALRLEGIVRLGANDLAVLVELLTDRDWRVRSRATDRLIVLGEAADQAVRPLLDNTRLEVRTAAARVLMELGQDAWLEERLL
jgi:hypothetical protein